MLAAGHLQTVVETAKKTKAQATMSVANPIARRLRKTMTPQEARLWVRLRQLKEQGFHFRRQVPIDGFIVDFACYRARLIVEVDGSQHDEPDHAARDLRRDAHLRAEGFRVLRFWNADVNRNITGVLDAILAALNEAPPPASLREAPSPQGGGIDL